jgi:hypothetical protein
MSMSQNGLVLGASSLKVYNLQNSKSIVSHQRVFHNYSSSFSLLYYLLRGRRGRDRMVAGLTTICTICAYHH